MAQNPLDKPIQDEANLILRFAVTRAKLSRSEELAVLAIFSGRSMGEVGRAHGFNRGTLNVMQHGALEKIRRQLKLLGIEKVSDIL